MPDTELVLVEHELFVRTYDYLSNEPVQIWSDWALSPRMFWPDWAWGSANPDPLPIPLSRTRYHAEFLDARPAPSNGARWTFRIDPTAHAVRCGRQDVPCPKVREGTETRWNGSYWQKWNKKRYDWEAI